MALPQRDKLIEEIRRIEGLLSYAEANGMLEEVERLRRKLSRLLEKGL